MLLFNHLIHAPIIWRMGKVIDCKGYTNFEIKLLSFRVCAPNGFSREYGTYDAYPSCFSWLASQDVHHARFRVRHLYGVQAGL